MNIGLEDGPLNEVEGEGVVVFLTPVAGGAEELVIVPLVPCTLGFVSKKMPYRYFGYLMEVQKRYWEIKCLL